MKKVILGLSGGVDSSVCAYLLKKDGYNVVPVFMRNWDSMLNNDILGNPNDFNDVCPQEKDYNDAQEVASSLGLELKRIDFVDEYWSTVFAYFLDEYKKGRTPNPDVMCNKYIKFKAFYDYANSEECDYIAMGHYANREDHDGISYLCKAKDENKDQTYFLTFISQEALKKTLFPIGNLTKPEVREIALEMNLATKDKKDSTGVCFIGERNFKEFLKNYIPANPGDIVDLDGNVIGRHDGVMYYTIGQRKGLNIGGVKGHECSSFMVAYKDLKNNRLVVCQNSQKDLLLSNRCICSELNEISVPIVDNKEYQFRFRHRGELYNGHIIKKGDKIEAFYDEAKSIAPGQVMAIYDGNFCLGGALIDEVFYNDERRSFI